MIKVRNMRSSMYNLVPNQFIISGVDEVNHWCEYFQSYQFIIVRKSKHKDTGKITITLDERHWDYNVTTGKYRNQFLGGEDKKETQIKIDSGKYKLANLN